MLEKNVPTYQLSADEILDRLDTDPEKGLSQAEVQKRLDQYGPNELKQGEHRSLLHKFIDQFKDFMIIVLLVAAAVSAFVGLSQGHGPEDAVIILIVVLLNAVIGVFQEEKAEEAIDALRNMSSPEAHVIRDGRSMIVKSTDLVPGDLIVLEAGDVVPADIRLLETNSLKIEEAALTGESVPVEKAAEVITEAEVGIGDRLNMAHASTNVTYGRGKGVVTHTAMDTEVGHIARMLEATEQTLTPLQRDQEKLGKTLTIAIIGIALLTFAIGTLYRGFGVLEMILVSISLAVAAIPEGLPAITTIILSLGTQTMAKRNALVRTLPAVETLGSTEVICSDKTGTLTLNQMTIEKVMQEGQIKDASEPIEPQSNFLRAFTFANDAKMDAEGHIIGDPTEAAMIQLAYDQQMNLEEQLKDMPRVGEVPFDSDRKLMSTVHQLPDGRYFVAVKGAPDQLLMRCTHIEAGGQIRKLEDEDIKQVEQANYELASHAMRVLGGAYKYLDRLPRPEEMTTETIEQDLTFVGLVGMIDPERPEARESIERAKGAGIRTVMITGDHAVTAQAIAERLHILDPHASDNSEHVITGAQLNEISDEDLARQVANYSVYARVSPEHKVRIIKAWQANDVTVSMTGDGVNDAPSLKQANIGVGMGITGTEVSKGASDMVLADDNFQTIVVAVEEGRKVFANIQKAVQYLLSANLGEVLTLFLATLFGWIILEPVHILWINLVTDVFPAIALGMEPAESQIMNNKPRTSKDSFLSFGVLPSIIYQGILEGGITLFVYWYARFQMGVENNLAETMAFITLGLIQLFHAYNTKSVFRSLLSRNPFDNKYLNGAFLLSGLLLVGVILIPGINHYFDVTVPNLTQWMFCLGASFSLVIFVEIAKWIFRTTGLADKFQARVTND